jgi:hypothetical protein
MSVEHGWDGPETEILSASKFGRDGRYYANSVFRRTTFRTGLPLGVSMRVTSFLIALLVLKASTALAGQQMTPNDIKATLFNGQPFTAASPSGTKFTMTFTPDGKVTRQTLAKSGKTNVGIWKLNAKGFCTSWEHAGSNCFTLIPSGENKWLGQKTGTTISTAIAVWSK